MRVPRIEMWRRRHFLWSDLAVCAGLCAVGGWWLSKSGWASVNSAMLGNRAAVYGALASISGSLLGFVITSVSIVLGFHERLGVLAASKAYSQLWDIYRSATRWLSTATLFALAALVFDRDTMPFRPVFVACAVSSLVAAMRIARCIWALHLVTDIVTAPSRERAGDTPPMLR